MARFTVTGINDRATFCECCGRANLKMVVWIADNETGEEKHFGTTCAMQPAKGFECEEEIKRQMKTIRAAQVSACTTAMYRYKRAGGAMINGRDERGSPIATVADRAAYDAILNEEMAKIWK